VGILPKFIFATALGVALVSADAFADASHCLRAELQAAQGRTVKRTISDTTFEVKEAGPEGFKFVGTVLAGRLEVDAKTVTEAGVRSDTLRGAQLFDEMMGNFKKSRTRIKAIRGHWLYGTNLEQFNTLIRSGRSPEQAALETWTGTQARRHGYNKAVIVSRKGSPPAGYWEVEVEFRKP
jgi:hypothetical protein